MAATWFTVSVKFCEASVPTPLCAVKVMGKVPEAVGVPARTPVAVLKVTPVGSAPDSLSEGAGKPESGEQRRCPGSCMTLLANYCGGAGERPVSRSSRPFSRRVNSAGCSSWPESFSRA